MNRKYANLLPSHSACSSHPFLDLEEEKSQNMQFIILFGTDTRMCIQKLKEKERKSFVDGAKQCKVIGQTIRFRSYT